MMRYQNPRGISYPFGLFFIRSTKKGPIWVFSILFLDAAGVIPKYCLNFRVNVVAEWNPHKEAIFFIGRFVSLINLKPFCKRSSNIK